MNEYERFITGTPRNRAEAQRHERTRITLSKTADGIPPARKSRTAHMTDAGGRYLEAWVAYTDGRGAVEHYEDNTPRGRANMDRWAFTRNLDVDVDYIAVQRVGWKAKQSGRGTYR